MPNGARHYAFTLNNYTEDELGAIASAAQSESSPIVYLVFGKEISPSGTPHLQGHVYLNQQTTLSKVKKLLSSRAHFSVARYVQRSIEYCKKEGAYTEYGVPYDARPGVRTDLQRFRDAVEGGMRSLSELRKEHPGVMARHPHFASAVLRDLRPRPTIQLHPLRAWQSAVMEILSKEIDPRKIHFVVDQVGNAGKSYLCSYAETKLEGVQVMRPGKSVDMAYIYDEDTKVLFIDVPRSKVSHFQYDFLEQVKDGRLVSSKYESVTKRFTPPHIVVFMNEEPDFNALSSDRYNLLYPNEFP